MTPIQLETVKNLLDHLGKRLFDIRVLIHGACKGADRQFHQMGSYHHMFPSNTEQQRWAMSVKTEHDIVELINWDPINRNHQMVDLGEFTIAAPSGRIEIFRGSGTWATMRYARKTHKDLYICWPDGLSSQDWRS